MYIVVDNFWVYIKDIIYKLLTLILINNYTDKSKYKLY